MIIETSRLVLVSCTEEILNAAIKGDEELSKILGCTVEANWSEFGLDAFPYLLDKISHQPNELKWWTFFPIHKEANQLIGSCGYKGQPDEEGMVEIGYEVALQYRNQGIATEISEGLIQHAFNSKNVTFIQAHTLAHENSSTRVLTKCGFEKIKEINDKTDGLIWQWRLNR